MASIEGIYKATIQLGEAVSPVIFILKGGLFEGFDIDDRRFRGTYAQDPDTHDVLMTAEMSFWTPPMSGQERTRQTRPFTVRLPAPPGEVDATIAATLDMDDMRGCVIIERLGFPGS